MQGSSGPRAGAPKGLCTGPQGPPEPIQTDRPSGLRLYTNDQGSVRSDIGHVTPSSDGPKGARKAQRTLKGRAGPKRSVPELMGRGGYN